MNTWCEFSNIKCHIKMESNSKMTNIRRFGEDTTEYNVNKKRKSNINGTFKILKSELYKPPTVEELNQLRETEILFNSNLFRLQTEELVKEVFVKQKRKRQIESWMEKFQCFTENLPEYCDCKFSDFALCVGQSEKSKLTIKLKQIAKNLPLKLKTDQNGSVKLIRPHSTEIIGLYKINAIIGPTINVSLNIVVPKSCFNEKDYLNSRYLLKRALYLSYIATHLKKTNLCTNMYYSYLNGNQLIPILHVIPEGASKSIVKIQITAQENSFKLSRFYCDKSNLRCSYYNSIQDLHTISSEESETKNLSTPFYNAVILNDLTLSMNDTFCTEKLSGMKGVCDGLILLTVWLRQRELIDGFGGFSEQLMHCLLAYLVHTGRLNKHMSSYQVIRNVWNHFVQSQWDVIGLSICDDKQIDIRAFHEQYKVVFVDKTGYYNLAANLDLNVYKQIQFEAMLALNYLDEGKLSSFQSLFMTKMNFYFQFDTVINIADNPSLNDIYTNVEDKYKMDYLHFKYPLIVNYILDTLKYGLTDRISHIVPKLKRSVMWEVGTKLESTVADNLFVSFGLRLNATNMFKIVNKGPPASDPLAAQFRDFWGEKSELRRFKDGSISEAVYWETTNFQEKRKISKDIIDFILRDKHKLENFNVVYDQLDFILQIFNKSTIEEANLKVVNIFDDLAKELRDLNLPLSISAVQGTSESFCHSDAFPPISMNYKCGQKITYETDNNILFRTDIDLKLAPKFIAPIQGIIQMVHHSKWPNDLDAMRNLRTAFYLQMTEQLCRISKENFSQIRTMVSHEYLDVLFKGLVFRFVLFHPKQISLIKKHVDDRGIVSFKDTPVSLQLEKEYVLLPKIMGALNGVHSQCPSFGPGTILMKRWMNAQLLDGFHVSPIVVSLLSASLYLDGAPFQPPVLPQIAFLRFLLLLVRHPFGAQPLVVNFNDEITKQQLNELETKFQQHRNEYPAICIATPFDFKSILTGNSPTKEILHRMTLLAKESLNIIEKNIHSLTLFNAISLFKPNLTGYNVIIYLQAFLNSKRHESIVMRNINRDEILKYDEKNDDKMPIINFDPVAFYLSDLRTNYSNFALFFHDNYGGNLITVLWKPNVFQKQLFKIANIGGLKLIPDDEKLIVNIDAIIEDFYILGNGIVKNIEVL